MHYVDEQHKMVMYHTEAEINMKAKLKKLHTACLNRLGSKSSTLQKMEKQQTEAVQHLKHSLKF